MRETERVESRARRDQGPHMRPRVASVPAWKPGRWLAVTSTAALTACWLVAQVRPAQALSSELVESLKASQYVYIASSRKDGSFGKPAEIWFMYHEGAVWVASPPTTWRVRRIRAGRPKARIAVGKLDGATFLATGSIVNDPALPSS